MEGRQMSNELTNYNPQRASLLDMRADAVTFPRIKTMPVEQAVSGMSQIVTQAFLYKGIAAESNNIRFIASSLVGEILEDSKFGASDLSLAEIQVVIKRAVLSSDMYGISVASLYRTIMDYVKGEGHNNQKRVDAMKGTPSVASPVNTMLQASAGHFIKNHKI